MLYANIFNLNTARVVCQSAL